MKMTFLFSQTVLKQSISGQELIERGFWQDVELASVLNNSNCVPLLTNKAYVKE